MCITRKMRGPHQHPEVFAAGLRMALTALLCLLSGLCWFFVFSKSVRHRMPTPWWVKAVSTDQEQQRHIADLLLFVLGLLMGILFTWISIVRLLINFSRG